MKFIILLLYLSMSIVLFASYYDSDIDGVEDRFDQCNNTPFDALVDEFGCSKNRENGTFTITVGTDIGFDTFETKSSTYSYEFFYKKNNWMIGLSNSNYIGYDENNITSRETGDIYTYIGYELARDRFSSIFALGTKVATAKDTVGTGENDYYMSAHFTIQSSDNLTKLFTTLSYTITGDTNTIKYEDIVTYNMGIEYNINDRYDTSIYYENSESIYQGTENFHAIVWSNHYTWKEHYFVECDYMRGLDKLSYVHMFSFRLGVTFE